MTTMSKSFQEYLTESKRTFPFKVKIAGEFTKDQEQQMLGLLEKYSVLEFKKTGQTPVQALPLDFPRVKNAEVNIYEVDLDYPVAGFELRNYLSGGLQIQEEFVVVRRPGEPAEEYQAPTEKREGALLLDPEYKEAGDFDGTKYYGDKYNESLIKTLNDDLKAARAARNEQIPTEGVAETSNSLPQNNKSPVAANPNSYVIKTRNGK